MKQHIGLALAVIILVSSLSVGGFLLSKNAPAPAPTSTPAPTVTFNADSLGICVHSLSEADALLVADSGVKWVRIDISNNETSTANSLINAKSYRLSVLGILGSWMFNQSCAFTLDAWSSSVRRNVTKYAQDVDAWEIWNEPTSTNPGWQLSADYLSMVQIASPIIRQIDPTAKIILLGGLQLYTGGNIDQLESDIAFADNLSQYNLMQYGDAISVHAYPWSGEVRKSVWDNYNPSIAKYREIFGNSSLDIWVTETGQNLTDCGNDQAMHAQYLEDALGFFNGTVSHVFWYALHDDNATQGDFGLVDVGMQPRQAYNALQSKLT